MNIAAGTMLGPYEIISPLGAGGMGEVYRARDTRLRREVAIKVLPAAFSSDADRLRRFEQEARAAGALNHPNILAIFDIGSHDNSPYVVSELLEGETLRKTIGTAALKQRKAIDYALQIASGLAAAHEKGIVHRDLKPENIFITRDGRAKVLDFGLAKLTQSQHPGVAQTEAPTIPFDAETESGVILGTVGYMSPEQVRGERVDHRSDIFSFGVILYEMLRGRRTFEGESAIEVMNAILKEEPEELTETNTKISPALERIVRRCLEKKPERRFQSTSDLCFAIESLSMPSGSRLDTAAALPAVTERTGKARLLDNARLAWLVAAGLLLATLGLSWANFIRQPLLPAEITFRYLTHSGHDASPAVSPDGRTLAFSSDRDGRPRIWLKQIQGGGEVALTSGPDDFPRFSPDGSTILFVRTEGTHTSLYRTGMFGGEFRRVVEYANDGDWSPDGRQVVFMRWKDDNGQRSSAIGLVGADGGGAREIALFENQSLRHPRWSPDGKWIATVGGSFQTGNRTPLIFLLAVDGTAKRTITPLLPDGLLSSVAWSRTVDELIYSQAESTLGAFTGSTARICRQDVRSGVAQAISWSANNGRVFDILAADRIVFDAQSQRENLREISLFGRDSIPGSRWLSRGNTTDRQPAYSPDGQWVAFASNRDGNEDLWEVSTETGAVRRLTDDAGRDSDPAFTPDGKRLIWASDRGGHWEIWSAERDGSNPTQVTNDGFDAENATATADGWVVYASTHPAKAGIWRIRLDGSAPTQLVAGLAILPEVSPDGQYASYVANPGSRQPSVRVVRIADGAAVPFEVRIEMRRNTSVTLGRARWMPESRAIAFVGQDERGINGIFVQDFIPGRDTSSSRRLLGGLDPEAAAESFGVSRDGSRITVASWEQLSSIMAVEGLRGIAPPARGVR